MRAKIWLLFILLAAVFVVGSLAIECPPTNVQPTPTEADSSLINYKLLCVKRVVEGNAVCTILTACDPDGEALSYEILSGPVGATLTDGEPNTVNLCWQAERGVHYLDIMVCDSPPDPNERLCDRGTIVYIVRKANQPPVFGGCR